MGEILASVALALAAAGLLSVIARLVRLHGAERSLLTTIENQSDILDALERTRPSLESARPDPEAVALARALIEIASSNLSGRAQRDIQTMLSQGSDKSQANLLGKLIDVLEADQRGRTSDVEPDEPVGHLEVRRAS
jgi:hypothetical protein